MQLRPAPYLDEFWVLLASGNEEFLHRTASDPMATSLNRENSTNFAKNREFR
jgi:hypothetical protein